MREVVSADDADPFSMLSNEARTRSPDPTAVVIRPDPPARDSAPNGGTAMAWSKLRDGRT